MNHRIWLIAATALSASPAFAAIDPPAASSNDARVRTVTYSATNPVQLPVSPGASVRLQLGADEEVVQVVPSDQGIMGAPELEEVASASVSLVGGAGSGPKAPASCDTNLCRSVVGNFVYLKPIRSLDPQPLFIQTKRPSGCVVGTSGCEMVPYTFELLTRSADVKAAAASVAWSVSFSYPDRERAAKLAEQRKAYEVRLAAWRERQANKPAPPAMPSATDNYRYGYRGSSALQPDKVWDDGRSTFMRFNGNRRLPDVFRRLPDGKESIPAYAPETDTTGTTLRIARTESKWFVRDGDEVGCVFNVGPDPDGRTAATVASRGVP